MFVAGHAVSVMARGARDGHSLRADARVQLLQKTMQRSPHGINEYGDSPSVILRTT